MKKKHLSSLLMALMLVAAFSWTAVADAPINPGGPFVPPEQDINPSAPESNSAEL